MCKVYAYLRVSTDKQDLENQRLEIAEYAEKEGLPVEEELAVEASSRKDFRIRRIQEMMDTLRRGDVLIVSEVSRLARSMREVHNIVHELAAKKIQLHIIKQGVKITGKGDLTARILLNSFAMAAEMERELISQRTKSGLARVRAEGRRLGNPNLKRINTARQAKADAFAEQLRVVLESLEVTGMTQRGMVEELNRLGIRTARGSRWTLCAVQRVFKRLRMHA